MMKVQLTMTRTKTNPFDDDHMHEECAIYIYGTNEANINTALGLHALQHRGQEAAGIVTFTGGIFIHRGLGHVGEILMPDRLKCRLYMGMWRLGIIAIRLWQNQCLDGTSHFLSLLGGFVLAHNGNLTMRRACISCRNWQSVSILIRH